MAKNLISIWYLQELEGNNLDVAMAQHLLVAADRFELQRLRRICERRLCETVEVSTSAHSKAISPSPKLVDTKHYTVNIRHRFTGPVAVISSFFLSAIVWRAVHHSHEFRARCSMLNLLLKLLQKLGTYDLVLLIWVLDNSHGGAHCCLVCRWVL